MQIRSPARSQFGSPASYDAMRPEGASSVAFMLSEDTSQPGQSWRVAILVRGRDGGLTEVGAVWTVPQAQGAPASRVIAYVSIAGATAYGFEAFSTTPGAEADISVCQCPYIGEAGLVASPWADREGDRYNATGGDLAAGVATVTIPSAGRALRRLWAIGVFQVGAGGHVSAPYPVGGTPPGTIIPIAPNGSINLHQGGGLVLPVSFNVNMPAGGGGWFAEWGE